METSTSHQSVSLVPKYKRSAPAWLNIIIIATITSISKQQQVPYSYSTNKDSSGEDEATLAVKGTNKVVQKICNQTSNYGYCVKALYRDSRTQKADDYTLAFIGVGMAYTNASATKSHIDTLLKNIIASSSSSSSSSSLPSPQEEEERVVLRRCSHDYAKAVSAFEMAYNDLNSETFFELGDLGVRAARAANDCQAALNNPPPLHSSLVPLHDDLSACNRDVKLFCQICVALGKLFSGQLP